MENRENLPLKETLPISLEETCIVGSVFFKDYSKDGTEGNVRGHETIDSVTNAVKKGCKVAFVIAPDTDPRFIQDLKEELKTLGESSENVAWRIEDRADGGYSGSRRQAVQLARVAFPESRAYIMQELEKNLTGNYESMVAALSDNKALIMMNRGVNVPYNENPWPDAQHLGANLPPEQFWGERHQNIVMANQEKAAGLTKENHFWDRLNGTRVIRNEPMKIGDVTINPSDLFLLKYEYTDGYSEDDRTYKTDFYSASTYNMVPILESLGAEDQIAELPIKYLHSEKQRQQEMSPEARPKFKEKRLKHKVDLPKINFDMVANIKEWKREGMWPQVLLDAVGGDSVLKITHFQEGKYSLTGTV